jgi:hypothetical protein
VVNEMPRRSRNPRLTCRPIIICIICDPVWSLVSGKAVADLNLTVAFACEAVPKSTKLPALGSTRE